MPPPISAATGRPARFPPPPFADLATVEESPEIAKRASSCATLSPLPEAQRMTVYLHYIGGYELTETAELLAVPLNTVKSRLRLARAKLRLDELTTLTKRKRIEIETVSVIVDKESKEKLPDAYQNKSRRRSRRRG